MDAPDNRTRAQRREEARRRVGQMLSLAEFLRRGQMQTAADILKHRPGPAEIHHASLRRLSSEHARFAATWALLVLQGLEVLAGTLSEETDDSGRRLTDAHLAEITKATEEFMLEHLGIPRPPREWRNQNWRPGPAEDRDA